MANRLNGFPPMGNPVKQKQVLKALKATTPTLPLAAIPNVSGTGETDGAVNNILAALRTLGLIAP